MLLDLISLVITTTGGALLLIALWWCVVRGREQDPQVPTWMTIGLLLLILGELVDLPQRIAVAISAVQP